MEEALRVFRRVFGRLPHGCWPSEGAISAPALRVIEAAGIEWAASSANVLRAGLAAGGQLDGQQNVSEDVLLNRAFVPRGQRLACFFFRHDQYSDVIGFTYQKWHGDDAARHFSDEMTQLAQRTESVEGRVVLIALDGENAWEYYPFNGYYFLTALYEALANNPHIELTTLSQFMADSRARGVTPATLEHVTAGSLGARHARHVDGRPLQERRLGSSL